MLEVSELLELTWCAYLKRVSTTKENTKEKHMKVLSDFSNCLVHAFVSELLKIGPVKIFLNVSTSVHYNLIIDTFLLLIKHCVLNLSSTILK